MTVEDIVLMSASKKLEGLGVVWFNYNNSIYFVKFVNSLGQTSIKFGYKDPKEMVAKLGQFTKGDIHLLKEVGGFVKLCENVVVKAINRYQSSQL